MMTLQRIGDGGILVSEFVYQAQILSCVTGENALARCIVELESSRFNLPKSPKNQYTN